LKGEVYPGENNMNDLEPQEIAPGVYGLSIGTGLKQANVYFVQSGLSWVLIDAAWPHCGQLIKATAESLFGANTRPAAILLTHIHPDHSGSALELAQWWNLPVSVHPAELPLAAETLIPEYFNPLDRWLIAPLMKLQPRRMLKPKPSGESLADKVCAIGPSAGLPGFTDWQCIPSPGHTPGHMAFFRKSDGVLIVGDAILTVNLNSIRDVLLNRQRISGPPYISTWNWPIAKESVARLAALEPRVLACGHGPAAIGPGTAAELRALSNRFTSSPRKVSH
jgi:glyoxylase-like metal-dependent hydrolase (beta-lactamase superfamily II)